MPLESNQPGDLPPVFAQYAGTSSLSGRPFSVQKPAPIILASETFSSMQHNTSHLSQSMHREFNFEHETMSHIAVGNVGVQCSGLGLDPTQQFSLQMPLVGSCVDANYPQPGNDVDEFNSSATPDTSTHFDTSIYISQRFMNNSERLQRPHMRKHLDTSHQVSQNSTYNAQLQNPQSYFSMKQQPSEDSTYHPISVQTQDSGSRFDMSHRTGPNFLYPPCSARPLSSGYYIDTRHQEPSRFTQQLNYPFHLTPQATMNPLDQYHESQPLMNYPHFQQSRSYDLRKQEDIVYHHRGDGLNAANALQNVLTQEEKGSRAAEQAYLARMERQRIGDCPPVGSRHEKRRWSELGAGRHIQQEIMSERRTSMQREAVNPALKSPTSIEQIVFTAPTTPENFTHLIPKDDTMQIEYSAKKRKTSSSHECGPSRHGLAATSPILLKDDAMSTARSPLTPATSSKLSAKSSIPSVNHLSLSQIVTISIPVQQHAETCETPSIGQQSGGFASRSNLLIGGQHQVTNKTLPSLMLGSDRNIPWPQGVPRPVGRHPVSVRGSDSPKASRVTISDPGRYPKFDLSIDTWPLIPLESIILTNEQNGKMLPDEVVSGKALSGSDDAVFSLVDLSDTIESSASMPPTNRHHVFSFHQHFSVGEEFEAPFRPYVHPDIGKITLTKPAAVSENLDIVDIDSSEAV